MILSTDDPIREMDQEFYRSFDPFSHFVAAELLATGELGEFSIELENEDAGNSVDVDDPVAQELHSRMREAKERAEQQRQVLTRVLRYFASETLFLMILASPPHDPFFRQASTLRGRSLNKVFSAISNRKIPEKFKVKLNGEEVDDFEVWLGLKLFKKPDYFRDQNENELVDLLVEEAILLSERGAINAFKHGRPVTLGQSLAGEIFKNDDSQTVLAEIVPVRGIQWIEWIECQDGFVVRTETEEFDYEYDKKRIFQIGLVSNAIKTKRLAEIDGKSEFTINLPNIKKLAGQVRRQHHQTRFGGSE